MGRVDDKKRVSAAVADLIASLPSPESRRAYEKDWERFAAWLASEGVDVCAARPRDVQRYIVHLRDQGRKKSTTARVLSVIREIYGALVREEVVAVNPAREVKNQKSGASPNTPVLDEAQVEAMLNVPAMTWRERRDVVCVALLFGLGWRRREIARLCVEDFRDSTVTGLLKGGKTYTVGVPGWLMFAIEEWRAFAGISSGALLPRSERDERSISGGMVYHIVRDVATRASVPLQVATPHALRRANITLGGARGVSLKARQLAVGHASQMTTERYDRAREAALSAPGEVFADLIHRSRK